MEGQRRVVGIVPHKNEWQKKQRLVEKGILHILKENGMGGIERGEVM